MPCSQLPSPKSTAPLLLQSSPPPAADHPSGPRPHHSKTQHGRAPRISTGDVRSQLSSPTTRQNVLPTLTPPPTRASNWHESKDVCTTQPQPSPITRGPSSIHHAPGTSSASSTGPSMSHRTNYRPHIPRSPVPFHHGPQSDMDENQSTPLP